VKADASGYSVREALHGLIERAPECAPGAPSAVCDLPPAAPVPEAQADQALFGDGELFNRSDEAQALFF
jgi:hypothetical protein